MKRLIMLACLLVLPLFVSQHARAQVDVLRVCKDASGNLLPAGQRPAICDDDATNNSDQDNPLFGPKGLVTKGVQVFAIIVGIAAIFVIVISGLRFVVSNGDSNSVASARNAILYAVIGLIIAALAQVIVNFVLSKL